MHSTLRNWLDEVAMENFIDVGEINEVAINNLVLFSTTRDVAKNIGLAEAEDFIHLVFEIYRKKLSVAGESICFYAWFDEMAGQLRCSATLAKNKMDLPFGCDLDIVETPRVVVEKFLRSPFLDGIPIGELAEISEDMVVDDSEYRETLTVFARMLS